MQQTIAIVRNLTSAEHDPKSDQLHKQVTYISNLLHELGWKVVDVEVDHNLKRLMNTLEEIQPDIIFNLLDSLMGSGEMANLITSLFTKLRIPFTGADSTVLAMTNDKLTTKWHLLSAGFMTPEGVDEKALMRGRFPGPGYYIIKNRLDHASFGLDETSVVHAQNAHTLYTALEHLKPETSASYMAERFIAGREFSVSIAESSKGKEFVLGIAEVVFPEEKHINIVGYKSLWKTTQSKKESQPASFSLKKPSVELTKRIEKKASNCWEELGLCGYARIVFRMDSEGQLYIIDVVANPHLSQSAAFLSTAKIGGWTPQDVISTLLEGAIARHKNKYKFS